MKKYFRFAFVILCMTILLSTGFENPISIKAAGQTIAQTREKIKKEQAALENKENELKLTNQEITTINNNVALISKQIEDATDEMIKLNEENLQLTKDIDVKREEINKVLSFLQLSKGESSYLEYAFGAKDFTDFIYRLAVTEQLTTYNNDLIKEFTKMIDENKRRTDELKVKEQELIVKQGQIQAELSKLERAKVQIDKDKGDVAASLKASLAVLDDLIKMGCHENEDINVCTERVNKLPSGDGTFIRPLRTGTVTSEFGWRNVNIPGATNNHIGIDIGAPFGTPVYATAPGRVIYPGWYGSAGQTIHVIHTINGVNYTSAYQHLNSINVSHNQIVQQGQIIGYVGSTGASSGPHLHFGLFYGWYGYDQSFWGGAYYANAMNPRTKLYFPPLYVYWRE